MHCSQDELNKMAAEQGFVPRGGYHRGRGGRFDGRRFDGPPRTHYDAKNGEVFQSGSFPHPPLPPHMSMSSSPPSSGHQDIRSSPPMAVSGHEEVGKGEVEEMEEDESGQELLSEQT